MTEKCLEVLNLTKEFSSKKGKIVVLENLNLVINRGEFISIVGTSGSGKSTLLRIIGGLEIPTTGTVKVNGQVVIGPGADRGMVFQKYNLYPWLTVQQNVEFGLKLQGMPRQQRAEMAGYYLDMVGLSASTKAYPHQLSGGMQQRVAIARSLATQPQILLMDEPFGALDIETRESMQEFLLEIWQRTQCTILMITHDVREAVFLSQRLYLLIPSSGVFQKEFILDLPSTRDDKVKRSSQFQNHVDEIMELFRAS